jgi:hypothetical protein
VMMEAELQFETLARLMDLEDFVMRCESLWS